MNPSVDRQLLREIANWKLEAKLEDSERYFYHRAVVDGLVSGNKAYVIGRKGTGKTAITQHLIRKRSFDQFAQRLTFKNFPFNTLYDLKDDSFTRPNQYITLWKYVIYSTVCKMLIENQSVDSSIRVRLKELYDDDLDRALPKAVKRWTGGSFDIKILGTGFGYSRRSQETNPSEVTWLERTEILETLLQEHLPDDQQFLVIFDELDEDYKEILDPDQSRAYFELLTSLFKAAQDIRSRFDRKALYPIIFLRDDIYDFVRDPDKTKWEDLRVSLTWDTAQLQKLLAFRISRALNPEGEILNFREAWSALTPVPHMGFGSNKRKKIPTYLFIERSTQLRPRDFIRYLQVCAEYAIEYNLRYVNSRAIQRSDKAFSNYLRSELQDEMHGILPEIQDIMSLFSTIRKQVMFIDQFNDAYVDFLSRNDHLPRRDPQFVTEQLFKFSVIGNYSKGQKQFFRYSNPEARLNNKEQIIIHRGLFKSFQIY